MIEVVLVYLIIVSNDYQKDSEVLYTFVPNTRFGNLLQIAGTSFIPLKIFYSDFQNIEVWFTYQSSQPLEIKNTISLTSVIK